MNKKQNFAGCLGRQWIMNNHGQSKTVWVFYTWGAVTGMFREIWVDTFAVDKLASSVANAIMSHSMENMA